MVTALDEKQLKHWESLLDKHDQSSNVDSCRRDIEAAVFSGFVLKTITFTPVGI